MTLRTQPAGGPPLLVALVASLLGACGSTVAFVDADGGLADGAMTAEGGMAADDGATGLDLAALAAETARWLEGQDAWIEHACGCTGNPGCGETYRGPVRIPEFQACAESFLAARPEAVEEITALTRCYADLFAEVAACLNPAACAPESAWRVCRDDYYCVYARCEQDNNPASEAMLDACTDRATVGAPGAPALRSCFP